jgi:hypothetical protein
MGRGPYCGVCGVTIEREVKMVGELVRGVHALLFLGLEAAIGYTLFCGVTGRRNRLLVAAIGSVVLEGLVLAFFDWRCPLTTLAERLGARHGAVADLFLPQATMPYVFPVSGALFGMGCALVLWRQWRG